MWSCWMDLTLLTGLSSVFLLIHIYESPISELVPLYHMKNKNDVVIVAVLGA